MNETLKLDFVPRGTYAWVAVLPRPVRLHGRDYDRVRYLKYLDGCFGDVCFETGDYLVAGMASAAVPECAKSRFSEEATVRLSCAIAYTSRVAGMDLPLFAPPSPLPLSPPAGVEGFFEPTDGGKEVASC